ncbi:MAG TPA: amino acid carrier protein [Nevskiaceae bacterium]|nr:amino acid carrier protein [Nevskiaceae bacterium]
MEGFFATLDAINGVMLGVPVLLTLLAVGVLFTLWSAFGQYRSLTHGVALVAGRVPGVSGQGEGVLSHFQALSAALSATVGLGNIGGVAIAVSLGGPGAVFWMWMVGFAGMALKSTEVTLSLLYRDTSDPDNPRGGTMWVAKQGLGRLLGSTTLGALIGALFAIPLIVFGITGGNMFQAWNVAETTRSYFGIEPWISGLILAVLVAAVILGGIRRIGRIAGVLTPFMCLLYVAGGVYVLVVNAEQLPGVLRLIFASAFDSAQASGAFTGAAAGTAFIYGMRRALFSSEAGLGSAPIAHAAVRTPEPVTEGVVAGLEPFIDTLIVCTITALVILVSGVWNRGPVAAWSETPPMVLLEGERWQPAASDLPTGGEKVFRPGDPVFVVVEVDGARQRLYGEVAVLDAGIGLQWRPLSSVTTPVLAENGLFADYPASTLTARAFDTAHEGLGRWMVTITIWLFALSTLITWSYYGEQGMVYLFGARSVTPYRVVWCGLIVVTCLGFIRTDAEIDTLSTVALGFMLAVNLPVMLLLGPQAMRAWHDYFRRRALARQAG